MEGANEYAKLFTTGQYGRLYLVSGSHARGKTFHIYVLPKGEDAIPNGPNGPQNKDAVEVYGIVGGQPGWTEKYGWLHEGRWIADFDALVSARRAETAEKDAKDDEARMKADQEAHKKKIQLLESY